MAIDKADFLAGISFFHVLARFRADFLATIETLPVFYIDVHPAQTGILRCTPICGDAAVHNAKKRLTFEVNLFWGALWDSNP